MHARTQPRLGLMGRAIHEAVGCFAAPSVRDRILEGALGLSPWSAIPEEAGAARAFIDGPLRMALVHYLGEHTAEAVIGDLESVQAVHGGTAPVAAVASAAAPSTPVEVPDDEAEPTARKASHVRPREVRDAARLYVASKRAASEAIVARFRDAVACVRASDLEQTLNSLRLLGGAESLVLLDGAFVAGRSAQIAQAFEAFKGRVFVVLWDTPGSDSWEMERACAGAGWAYLPAEADAEQVIAFLGRLIR